VLDLFLGSGSTMIAAENLNRRCYAMEIDPAYCAVVLDRITTAFPKLKIQKSRE
jgi:DNA modification methylase